MWLVKPAVIAGALWVLLETLKAKAAGAASFGAAVVDGVQVVGQDVTGALECASDEFAGLWNGQPACLHHGGVSGPMDGGALDGSSGPVTSPDGL